LDARWDQPLPQQSENMERLVAVYQRSSLHMRWFY
jgi:hypothetical protein